MIEQIKKDELLEKLLDQDPKFIETKDLTYSTILQNFRKRLADEDCRIKDYYRHPNIRLKTINASSIIKELEKKQNNPSQKSEINKLKSFRAIQNLIDGNNHSATRELIVRGYRTFDGKYAAEASDFVECFRYGLARDKIINQSKAVEPSCKLNNLLQKTKICKNFHPY